MFNRALPSKRLLNHTSKIRRSYIKFTLQLVVFFILTSITVLVQGNEPKSNLSVEELKEIATVIKAVEDSLFNIKIESEAWVETKTSLFDPCEPWERTPIYVSSTAWFDGKPEGKARVDVHRQVFEGQQSVVPYGESSSSFGFNGQYGRIVNHTSGRPGKTFALKKGDLLHGAPRSLRTGWCERFTGAAFSLNLFNDEIYSFSKIFELGSDANSEAASELEFTVEEFQGVECIKIRSKLYHSSYWLDPSHGFALRGNKSIAIYQDGHEELVTFMEVTKLKEVTPGVWWPIEASFVSRTRPSKPVKAWRRFVYRASNVVANDPNFDESVFTVPFPEGYLIEDKVKGTTYRVGQEQKIKDK